jgi:uncharacterized repeat protein (TIGR02543 family)
LTFLAENEKITVMIRKTVLTDKMKLLSLGLTAALCLLCLLVSCKDPVAPEPGPQPVPNYTVSFQSEGGTPIADIKVRKGTILHLRVKDFTPEQDGYFFNFWYLKGDAGKKPCIYITVNGNITLVADWTKLFIVTLELGEGGSLGRDPNISILPGTFFEPGAYRPFRKGFLFQYWYLKDDQSKAEVESVRVDRDITLVAEWGEAWAVTLVLNGGVYDRDYINVAKGDNVTISLANIKPVRNDYVFDGWYYDEYFIDPVLDDTITVTGDITLYVKWVRLSIFENLLGVWTGIDGTYLLDFEESRLFGFYSSLDEIRSFAWSLSIMDGKKYSSGPLTLTVGEGEDAKTFTPATQKRSPKGDRSLSGTWIKIDPDDMIYVPERDILIYDFEKREWVEVHEDAYWIYNFEKGIWFNLLEDGKGDLRANGKVINISYMVTSVGGLYLLRHYPPVDGVLPDGEVLLSIPIEEGKPLGFEKWALTPF